MQKYYFFIGPISYGVMSKDVGKYFEFLCFWFTPARYEKEKNKFMIDAAQSVVELLSCFQKSAIYNTAAPEKSSSRDDFERIASLVASAVSGKIFQPAECDTLQSQKALATKRGTTFYTGLVTFPVGSWVLDKINEKITQCKQDQLLGKEFESIVEFADGCKSFKVDSLTKKDKDSGNIDIYIPSQNKVIDMVAKYFSFVELASDHAKGLMETQMKNVAFRIAELQGGLVAAAALKHDDFAGNLCKLLLSCCGGSGTEEWNDERSSECCQALSTMKSLGFWVKIQLSKLLGKQNAATLDKWANQIASLSASLQGAFPKLCALRDAQSTDTIIMSAEIKGLYTFLRDKDMNTAVHKLMPKMVPGLLAASAQIDKAVEDCLSKLGLTFSKFLQGILATEPQFDSILQSDIVGTVDVDTDGKNKVDNDADFGGIYLAYGQYLPPNKKIKVRFENASSDVSVHASFICLAGALLQMSKYALMIIETVETANATPDIKQVINEIITYIAQKKDHSSLSFKCGILKLMLGFFPGLSRAGTAFTEIIGKVGEDMANIDQIKDYHRTLLNKLESALVASMTSCSLEIDVMQKMFKDAFIEIKAAHPLPALFRASPLDKDAICKLCQDSNVKMVLFAASKVSSQCELMIGFLTGLKSLTILQQKTGTGVAALLTDLRSFSSTLNAKTMPGDDNTVVLANVTYFQGSVSLSQAMVRTLGPGETRTGLVSKCLALLEKNQMAADPILAKRAKQVLDGKWAVMRLTGRFFTL